MSSRTTESLSTADALHRPVIEAARTMPGRLAVAGPGAELTYAELDRTADALAHRLRDLGVRPGDRVVLYAAKSAAVVVGMQAVLRLGAAYVPADGSLPVARVSTMARDCAAAVVLVDGARLAATAADLDGGIPCAELAQEPDPAATPVDAAVGPDDLAYILYTSGSTGTPKGVCVSHRNARAFVDWVVDELKPTADDRFSSHAPFGFDLSVLDLYAAFSVGASVHLIPHELAYAPAQLVDFVYEQRITVWYSVPSALTLMMRDGGLLDRPAPPALRTVLFAGEPFPIAQVKALAAQAPGRRLLNLYGPTETNVCTAHEVTPADLDSERPLPIGRAVSGDRVWAEAPDGGRAATGEEGELLVDGPTVMLGYWGREPHGDGPYRTGDLVRELPDGSYAYVGRRDHMVKVRGHRIELGEIEAVLALHEDVAEAAVVVTGTGMDTRLTAFVLPAQGREPGVLGLKAHASRQLPRYMLADDVRIVAELPRTANGKTDRRRLAASLEESGS
ncbi:amino acid adenylation domain-containing protein [Streptomyces sp. NPDC086554]|uniref:amino acid adenylation domain-containing protein n=1 Tax=Streptomyces sp. NPDC086554 TaxID=3154864 RepID=UPI0034132936